MAQKTYRDLLTFRQYAGSWLASHKEPSKFRYGVKKIFDATKTLHEQYDEQLQDLSIEHCTEKDGVIATNAGGGFQFSKENLRKRNAATKELSKKLVDVPSYMAKEPPKDLSDDEREAFAGFVLPDLADEEPTEDAMEQAG